MFAFIGLPGNTEWIIILIIALLIFGKRLPEVMRSMGQSVKQFKKGMEEADLGDDNKHENDHKTDTQESADEIENTDNEPEGEGK